MSITEFVVLKLKAPYTTASEPLPELLELVRKRQSEWSSYPFFYFADINDNATLYFIAGWDSVEAHKEWMKSDANQELLTTFGLYMDDALLRHLDIPFERDRIDVGQIVYQNTHEMRNEEEGVIWTVSARDLEHPNSGWHHLTSYSHTLQKPLETETSRKVLERLGSEDRAEC